MIRGLSTKPAIARPDADDVSPAAGAFDIRRGKGAAKKAEVRRSVGQSEPPTMLLGFSPVPRSPNQTLRPTGQAQALGSAQHAKASTAMSRSVGNGGTSGASTEGLEMSQPSGARVAPAGAQAPGTVRASVEPVGPKARLAKDEPAEPTRAQPVEGKRDTEADRRIASASQRFESAYGRPRAETAKEQAREPEGPASEVRQAIRDLAQRPGAPETLPATATAAPTTIVTNATQPAEAQPAQ